MALNAVIQNLTAINLNVGPGTGLAGSGFRFRALNDDGNGSPIFDVYYGDKRVFQIDVTSGDIYFGGGLTYHASSDTIEANSAVFNGITIDNTNGGEADFGSALFKQQNQSTQTVALSSTGQCMAVFNQMVSTYGINVPSLTAGFWSEFYPCSVTSSKTWASSIAWVRLKRVKTSGYGAEDKYYVYFYNSSRSEVSSAYLYHDTARPQDDTNPFNNGDIVSLKYGGNVMFFYGLPTTSAGLASGRVWNDQGTLKIVT